jgi:hypothetical protein
MLNHYDLGLYVGWFEIPRDFSGLPKLYGLKCENLITSVLFLYLCSYNLDGSVTAGIRARFNIKHVICVFKTKVLFYKISFINL